MTLPNFLVAGSGRCGSTWLHVCLEEHPEVYVPGRIKEVNFFSTQFERGPDWYRSFFGEAGAEKAVGEVSPSYMSHPDAPRRIREQLPECRLLFLLRDPIARAYSHYCMHLRAGAVGEDVDREIRPGTPYVEYGLYHKHISRYLALFPRDRIGLLLYDDLENDPEGFLRQTYGFLQVDPAFLPSMVERSYHGTKPRPRFQRWYNLAVRSSRALSRRSPALRRLTEAARKRGLVNVFHRLNRGPEFPELSAGRQRELAALFRPDLEGLAALLDRDLGGWLDRYA